MISSLPIEILGLMALTAAAIATALWTLITSKDRGVRARLRAITRPDTHEGTVSLFPEDTPKNFWERVLIALGKRQSSGNETRRGGRIDTTLRHAGFRRGSAVHLLLGARLLLMIGLPTLAASALLAHGTRLDERALVILASLAGVGYLLPTWTVGRLADRRIRLVDAALPDVLDLLVLCVEAGLAVPAAISRVADDRAQLKDPLADDLALLARELRVGVPRREALRSFADRTGSTDLRTLVSHLVQTDRLGGDLGPALRAQAESVRTTRKIQVEEVAQRMPVRMLLPTMMFMPALFIVIFVPVGLHAMKILSGG